MKGIKTVCSTKELNPEMIQLFEENGIDVFVSGSSEISHIVDINTSYNLHRIQGVIVCTSQHAVRSLALHTIDYKDITGIFCLSGATQSAAKKLPVSILGMALDAVSLASKILESGIDQVTFLCTDKHRPELPKLLREHGVRVDILIVYSVKFHSQKIVSPFDFILFFSPNAIDAFLQANELPETVICFCIGKTTAQFLRYKAPNQSVIVSPFPSQACMVNEVIQFALSNNSPHYATAETV